MCAEMQILNFLISDRWKRTYPHAAMGVLAVSQIENNAQDAALEAEKNKLEDGLRQRFGSREAIKADAVLQAYAAYYKPFKKNYHVFFQIESVAVKGQPIPRVNALVEAMFMAELKHGLLTAGHDLDILAGDVVLDAASGDEEYITISGEAKTLKAGDMFVRDAQGVLSSIIYEPDQRTRIGRQTQRVFFSIYAPDGIGQAAILAHMQDIYGWIRLFSPGAVLERMDVFSAAMPQGSAGQVR